MTDREELIAQRLRQEKGAREERERKAAREQQVALNLERLSRELEERYGKAQEKMRREQEGGAEPEEWIGDSLRRKRAEREEQINLIGKGLMDYRARQERDREELLKEVASEQPLFIQRVEATAVVSNIRRTPEAWQKLRVWQKEENLVARGFAGVQKIWSTSLVGLVSPVQFVNGDTVTSSIPTPLDPPACPTPTARRILFAPEDKEK